MATTHIGIGLTGKERSLDKATNVSAEDDAKVIDGDNLYFYKAYTSNIPSSSDPPDKIVTADKKAYFKLMDIKNVSGGGGGSNPMMYVVDEKPNLSNGGSSVIGANHRVLNTVKVNEIDGAYLSNNWVTLPAGIYWIECTSPVYKVDNVKLVVMDSTGNYILTGTGYSNDAGDYTVMNAEGYNRVVFDETRSIKVVTYVNRAQSTNGLGRAGSINSPSDTTEIYTTLRIWKLDEQVQRSPIVSKPLGTAVSGVPVTGGIMGLEVNQNSLSPDDTVDISPGTCMDDTLQEEMVLDGTGMTIVLNSASINTIYHVFLTKDDGSISAEFTTDEYGTGLNVDYKRWIGFVRTNSSGDICVFAMNDNVVSFGKASENILASSLTSSFASYDHSSLLPVNRIRSICYGVRGYDSNNGFCAMSYDGTNVAAYLGQNNSTNNYDTYVNVWGKTDRKTDAMIAYSDKMKFEYKDDNIGLSIRHITLKR